MAPACPACGSMHVVATQAERGEWTAFRCRDCGREWSHRSALRCPMCGEPMRPVYGLTQTVERWDCPHCRVELRRY